MTATNLFLLAGHTPNQPGARSYDSKYEYYYNLDLKRRVVRTLTKRRSFVSVRSPEPHLPLGDVIRWVNRSYKPGDLLLDIHFNFNHPTATGTEVFLHPLTSPKNKEIARSMVWGISKQLEIPVRVAEKHREYKFPDESALGTLGIIERTNIPAILIEVCFMNSIDLPKYHPEKKRNAVATQIVEAYRFPTMIRDLDPKTERRV